MNINASHLFTNVRPVLRNSLFVSKRLETSVFPGDGGISDLLAKILF